MKYTATYLLIGEGPKYLDFWTNKTDENEIREEAWYKAAHKEGVEPEKIEILDCKPS